MAAFVLHRLHSQNVQQVFLYLMLQTEILMLAFQYQRWEQTVQITERYIL